jgi:hypothetical protein
MCEKTQLPSIVLLAVCLAVSVACLAQKDPGVRAGAPDAAPRSMA